MHTKTTLANVKIIDEQVFNSLFFSYEHASLYTIEFRALPDEQYTHVRINYTAVWQTVATKVYTFEALQSLKF